MYSSSGNQRELRVAAHCVERSQLKRLRNLTRMPPVRGVPGMCSWAMALGWAQDSLEKLHFPVSQPGSAFGYPRRNWKVLLMRGGLNHPTNTAASATPPQIKGRRWMDNLQLSCAYSLHCRTQMTVLPKPNKMQAKLVYRALSVELSSKWQKGYLG